MHNMHCKEYKLSNIKIFCISLNDAKARRESILKMKNELELNLEFINAIDGRKKSRIEIESMTKRSIRWNCLNGHRDEIKTPTEAACSLSHLAAWERIISEDLNHAIVIEDDVTSHKNYKLNIVKDAEFVYLSTRANRNQNSEACAPICGSEAYYLTNTCAAKLLEINHELRMPVDIQWLPQMESLIESDFFLKRFTDKNLPILKAYVLPNIFTLNDHHRDSMIRNCHINRSPKIMAPVTIADLIEKLIMLQITINLEENKQSQKSQNNIQEFRILQQRWKSLEIQNNPILTNLISQFKILLNALKNTETQLLDENIKNHESLIITLQTWRKQKALKDEMISKINQVYVFRATKKENEKPETNR